MMNVARGLLGLNQDVVAEKKRQEIATKHYEQSCAAQAIKCWRARNRECFEQRENEDTATEHYDALQETPKKVLRVARLKRTLVLECWRARNSERFEQRAYEDSATEHYQQRGAKWAWFRWSKLNYVGCTNELNPKEVLLHVVVALLTREDVVWSQFCRWAVRQWRVSMHFQAAKLAFKQLRSANRHRQEDTHNIEQAVQFHVQNMKQAAPVSPEVQLKLAFKQLRSANRHSQKDMHNIEQAEWFYCSLALVYWRMRYRDSVLRKTEAMKKASVMPICLLGSMRNEIMTVVRSNNNTHGEEEKDGDSDGTISKDEKIALLEREITALSRENQNLKERYCRGKGGGKGKGGPPTGGRGSGATALKTRNEKRPNIKKADRPNIENANRPKTTKRAEFSHGDLMEELKARQEARKRKKENEKPLQALTCVQEKTNEIVCTMADQIRRRKNEDPDDGDEDW